MNTVSNIKVKRSDDFKDRKPYTVIGSKDLSTPTIKFINTNGERTTIPSSSYRGCKFFPQENKLVIDYLMSGYKVTIKGRSLDVLEDDIAQFKVPIVPEREGEDDKGKLDCYIDSITVEDIQG